MDEIFLNTWVNKFLLNLIKFQAQTGIGKGMKIVASIFSRGASLSWKKKNVIKT